MPSEANDKRNVPLLRILARLWLRRNGRRWIMHGHDEHGRRASLRVSFDENGVAVVPSRPGGVVLAPLQAGRLRAAIRDAIQSIDQPALAAHEITKLPADPSAFTVRPATPRPRVRTVLDDPDPATKPKFRSFDIAVKLGADEPAPHGPVARPAWPAQGSGPAPTRVLCGSTELDCRRVHPAGATRFHRLVVGL